ncbi:MAG: histidine kinase, partial [Rhodocyclaceae bacterium]|nr:histidine kinase [Rhodocyclaceae bacterium]
ASALGIAVGPESADDPAGNLLRSRVPAVAVATAQVEPGGDPVLEALAGSALLQPLQQNLFGLDTNAEILLSLRESARILFGVAHVAFLLPSANGKTVSGARVGGQPPLLQRLEIPLDPARSLPALAAERSECVSGFDAPGIAPSLIDVMLVRALGTEGMLCLPMQVGGQLEGIMVFGLSAAQHQRLARRMPWLASFARIAAVGLETWRRAREDRQQVEAEVAGRFRVRARQVAHEAGNPLAIIRNYLGVLGQRLQGDLKNELGILNEELDRVAKIVRGLSELENHGPDGGSTDVNQVIREMLAIYRESLFDAAGISLDLDLDPALPPMDLPRDPLKQILLNLWKNASEAMPLGGRLSLATRAAIAGDGIAQLEIVVGDSGPGLPEDVRNSLYQPLGADRKRGHQGLGLSIVSNLVRQLGGQITCATRPGTGTRFTVLLPRPPAVGARRA